MSEYENWKNHMYAQIVISDLVTKLIFGRYFSHSFGHTSEVNFGQTFCYNFSHILGPIFSHFCHSFVLVTIFFRILVTIFVTLWAQFWSQFCYYFKNVTFWTQFFSLAFWSDSFGQFLNAFFKREAIALLHIYIFFLFCQI